jgi:uncharacterized cupin superfamily protein
MYEIKVKKFSKEELDSKGVFDWPVWEKEVSKFDWYYDSEEHCYILEGRVKVIPEDGEAVEFGPGEYVIFPEGMGCKWEISEPVRKHYNFR